MPKTTIFKAFAAFTVFLTLAFFAANPQSYAQEANSFEVLEVEEEETNAPAETSVEDEAADATSDDPDAAVKFELAKKILKINPVQKDLDDAVSALAQQVPANRRVLFKSIIDRSIKIDRLNTAAQLAFVEVFTVSELQTMLDYYSSEDGMAIQEKMPEFEEKLEPVIRSMVEDAVFNIKNSNVDFSK
jgi:hypothetical protein